MKKFRYQSLVGICLIFLFLVNIALIIAGLVTAEILLIAAGILLSVLQVILHRLFERKAGVWRPDSLSSLIYQYVKSTSPGLAERLFSRDDGLLRREEKELILNRSHNIPTEVMSYKIQDNWGSQWLKQKDSPSSIPQRELRVAIGNQQCSQPYDASILNIGYTWQSEASGDLAFVLSEGCRIGGFAISTGLSGITPALIRGGGDLVWQIPFASGELSGGFNEAMFERYSGRCYVKMIEVVVSDPFISCSRAVGTDSNLISKKWHQSTWFLEDALLFLDRLRTLSEGKPIGIKPLIESDVDVYLICRAILTAGIYPDFITIETNTLRDGGNFGSLSSAAGSSNFVALTKKFFEVYKIPTKVILSGDTVTELDLLRGAALGADAFFSSRAMVFCGRYSAAFGKRGVEPIERSQLVANLHKNTVEAAVRLMEHCGYTGLADISSEDFYQCSAMYGIRSLKELYFNQSQRHNADVFWSPVLN